MEVNPCPHTQQMMEDKGHHSQGIWKVICHPPLSCSPGYPLLMLCKALGNIVGSITLITELIHGDVKPANQVKQLSDPLHVVIGDPPKCQREAAGERPMLSSVLCPLKKLLTPVWQHQCQMERDREKLLFCQEAIEPIISFLA